MVRSFVFKEIVLSTTFHKCFTFIYFSYFWLCWIFVAVCGLLIVVASLVACELWVLGSQASVVVACGLSSCGARA